MWRLVGRSLGIALAASTPTSLAHAENACSMIRAQLVQLDRAGITFEDGPIQSLAKRPHPVLTTDGEGRQVDVRDAKAAKSLAGEGAPANLVKKLRASSGDPFVQLHRSGALGMIETFSGPTECSEYSFFEANGRRVSRPPSLVEAGRQVGPLCGTDRGYLGQIGGSPAFIRETRDATDLDYAIAVSRWHGGRWTGACHLKVSYRVKFRLTRRWCAPGILCSELAGQVVPLAVRLQENPHAQLGAPAMETAVVRNMAALAREQAYAQLPDQMLKPDDPYPGLGGGEDAFFPIAAGGKTYLARLGRATLGYGRATMGWLQIINYNMVVYTMDSGQLKTIAGFVVEAGQGPLRHTRLGE